MVEVPIFYFLVPLVFLIIASITDLKTMTVPDWVSYPFILLCLSLSVSYFGFKPAFLGLGAYFIMGYFLFWKDGIGGADVKILMGIGALFSPFMLGVWSMLSIYLFILMVIMSIDYLYYFWKNKGEKKYIPFIPSITFTYIICSLIQIYL